MKGSRVVSPKASFAHTYGITRGNKEKAMGLNPNLNIQDQYIQNLLKQVNFLNIEIRLLKEKQNQTKSLGIMGLIDRDQQPLVSHAVESNQKFQSMKGNLQHKVSDLQTATLLLEDQNTALFAQKQFLERELGNEQMRLETLKGTTGKDIQDAIDRVQTFRARLFDVKEQNSKVQKAYDYSLDEYQRAISKNQIQKLLNSVDENLKGEESEANQKSLNDKSETAKSNQARWESVSGQFKQDPQYLYFIEQNTKIREKLRVVDKQVFNLGYKAKEFEELKSLSERNIAVEKELTKEASIELQKLTEILREKQADFDKRIVERKKMADIQPETKRLEKLAVAGDEDAEESKKKTSIVQGVYKKYRQQILTLESQYQSMKLKNKLLAERETELLPEVNRVQSEYNQASVDLEGRQKELEVVRDKYYVSKKSLLKLEEELSYLNAKQQFFERTLNVNEELNSLRLEELRGISQNNSSVNDSIDMLLGKMDQMRRFAKDPMVISNVN